MVAIHSDMHDQGSSNARRVPLIIAHRGDSAAAPESTLRAFESAIAKGADGIECDLHLTGDGQIVIHHDTYLGRTESGSGPIGGYSLPELKQMDVGSWFHRSYAHARIPTLDELFELATPSIRFEIELRTPSLKFLKLVLDKIVEYRLETQVELTSPHIPLLCQAALIAPTIRTGMFFGPFPDWMKHDLRQEQILGWLQLSGVRTAHLGASELVETVVARIHESGFLVHGADINTAVEIENGLQLGIDQFSTDSLDLALRLRQEFLSGA
jgi:glycerophosphoryl diester phosphodiesterase